MGSCAGPAPWLAFAVPLVPALAVKGMCSTPLMHATWPCPAQIGPLCWQASHELGQQRGVLVVVALAEAGLLGAVCVVVLAVVQDAAGVDLWGLLLHG